MPLPLLLLALTQEAGAAPAGRLVVLNKAEASASLLDLASGSELARLPVGLGPHEVAVSPDGRIAVVANYGTAEPGCSLTVLDLAAERPVRTLDLGRAARPHGILYDADGEHVWVTAEQRQSLLRVRVADGAVDVEWPAPQPVGHMVARGADSTLFVSHIGGGGVTRFPGADAGGSGDFFPTGAGAEGLALDSAGSVLWVGNRSADTLTVINASNMETLATLPAAGFPIRVAFTPDDETVLVSCAQAGALRFYDAQARQEIGMLDFAAQVRADRAGGRLHDDFGDSPVPIGIVVAPAGARAYVALANADRIAEVDLKSRGVARWLRAGREPDGMAWYPGAARSAR